MNNPTLLYHLRNARCDDQCNEILCEEAAVAIDTLTATVMRLKEALESITVQYDPSDCGGIAESMFDIAFDAQIREENQNAV